MATWNKLWNKSSSTDSHTLNIVTPLGSDELFLHYSDVMKLVNINIRVR